MTGQRHAIVTGGGQGIGLAVARRLLEDDWRVTVVDAAPGEAAADAALSWVELDVSDAEAVARVVPAITREAERLDLLVNNAGISRRRPLEHLTLVDWQRVIDVDLTGVFLCLQAAGRIMLERESGVIVNIASVAAARGCPGRGAYGPAKAAVVNLTMTAAVEWAKRGVRVNAVGPGYVTTPGAVTPRLDYDEVLGRIPMRTLATPRNIADAVAFLASPAAEYITGQVLYVDGGFLADYGIGLSDDD